MKFMCAGASNYRMSVLFAQLRPLCLCKTETRPICIPEHPETKEQSEARIPKSAKKKESEKQDAITSTENIAHTTDTKKAAEGMVGAHSSISNSSNTNTGGEGEEKKPLTTTTTTSMCI